MKRLVQATSAWVEWAWRKIGGRAIQTAPRAALSGRDAPTRRHQAATTAAPRKRKGSCALSSKRLSRGKMQFQTARSSRLAGLPWVQMLGIWSQRSECSWITSEVLGTWYQTGSQVHER
ncbi:MAG: hypothetical protein IPF99_00220 [Deltaproteobacteria bacterium]|nr:hypothetical protein [Deltaproteobacteria bacterium]